MPINDLKPGSNDSVPDPWYGTERDYTPVFHMISQTCDAIIARYANA